MNNNDSDPIEYDYQDESEKKRKKIDSCIDSIDKQFNNLKEDQQDLKTKIDDLKRKISICDSAIHCYSDISKFRVQRKRDKKRRRNIHLFNAKMEEFRNNLSICQLKITSEDTTELSNLHRTAQIALNSLRQTLWEEQKHFTWWISVILSSIILIFLNDTSTDIIRKELKFGLIIGGAVLGIIISFFGIFVIHREGVYFKTAKENLEKLEEKINFPFEKGKTFKFTIKYLFIIIFIVSIVIFGAMFGIAIYNIIT